MCGRDPLALFFSSLRFSVIGWKFFPFSTWPAFTFPGKLLKLIANKRVSIVWNYTVWDNIRDEMLYCFVWDGHCGSVWQLVSFPGGGFYIKQFSMSVSLVLTRSLFLKMLLSAAPWPDSKSGNNFLSIKIPLEVANSQVLKTLEFNLSG